MENISFASAWAYCFHTASYVLWLIGAALVSAGIIYALVRNYKRNQDWSTGNSLLLFLALCIFVAALLVRPGEISANTTKEQFEKGIIIGY
jgi:4-amino-4-deoxy-L-arabinose transferase-like glycosyltransferase